MSETAPSRFAILLDGALTPTARLHRQVEDCRLIAADGGIRHAEALGRDPEMWLGDFDSVNRALAERFANVPRDAHSPDKNISDGQIAIQYALEQGARELVLAGALGGERSDHAMFNLAGAAGLAARRPGLSILLTSGHEEALPLLPGEPLEPDWPEGAVFSVVGFTALSGLTVTNAKWPLDDVHVPFGSTWTLSNVNGGKVQISLQEGCGVAICQLV